jgi:alpha-amylase
VNYLSSHDDGGPFDQKRERPFESGTKLLLCPGAVQVYYGDESSRSLVIDGTNGDATLRSFMNWDEIDGGAARGGHEVTAVLEHWQKIGRFRANHPAVGAGKHKMISRAPYIFKRTLENDKVIVGLDMPIGEKTINVSEVFDDDTELVDYYSGADGTVVNGKVEMDTPFAIVLMGK